jgi:hypothetical protein
MNTQMGKHGIGATCAAVAVLVSVSALAAEPCPNNHVRTSRGKCVETELSSSLRQRAIEMSQQKLSETSAARSPAYDRRYPRANDINRYELNKGNFSTYPYPPAR